MQVDQFTYLVTHFTHSDYWRVLLGLVLGRSTFGFVIALGNSSFRMAALPHWPLAISGIMPTPACCSLCTLMSRVIVTDDFRNQGPKDVAFSTQEFEKDDTVKLTNTDRQGGKPKYVHSKRPKIKIKIQLIFAYLVRIYKAAWAGSYTCSFLFFASWVTWIFAHALLLHV